MAQAATMGPPLSPRETRRSGRRSAPSVSASASKSPDSDQPPRDRTNAPRVASSSSTSRSKKFKQEDYDEPADERKQQALPSNASSGSNSTSGNNNSANKSKRKPKDKQSENNEVEEPELPPPEEEVEQAADEDEEQGITRCVCGSAEDDPDAGEFMVQCETCKVWQHGLCMGYISEDQVHDDDYYCELCKPEMHVELLKKLARKPRQASSSARQDPSAASRVSRSHSPSYLLKQTSKRRNTMNSRDAAFDESLKEIIEATAAEAAAVNDASVDDIPVPPPPEPNDAAAKKKRKRTDEETVSKKRTRSASTASDAQIAAVPAPVEPPPSEKASSQPPKSTTARNKRGGARKSQAADSAAPEPEEAAPITAPKRPAGGQRTKNANAPKRPAFPTSTSQGSGLASHEHGTRRNQGGGGQSGSNADARAYRQSHAYAVSQQTLFTSWNLPDYLSHLEQMLPTDTPQPLEVRSGVSAAAATDSRGESSERTMERGVKVKWPAKRMSVGDMNKRVRSLVEWVGREQVNAQDRGRRREALEKALRQQADALTDGATTNGTSEDVVMMDRTSPQEQPTLTKSALTGQLMSKSALEMSAQTMKMMEELMEELIGFQERFGPGAKSRERRLAA